jgi:hypothetical protein
MPIWAYTQEKSIFYNLSKLIFSPKTAFCAKLAKKMYYWLRVKCRFDTKNQ